MRWWKKYLHIANSSTRNKISHITWSLCKYLVYYYNFHKYVVFNQMKISEQIFKQFFFPLNDGLFTLLLTFKSKVETRYWHVSIYYRQFIVENVLFKKYINVNYKFSIFNTKKYRELNISVWCVIEVISFVSFCRN